MGERPPGDPPPSASGARLAGRGLGPSYAKLWTAVAISSVGDGMFVTALPLLAAELTRDPLSVAAVAVGGWLPWLLLGLVSGALVDRLDRRRVMWTVDALRFALVAAFACAVVAGWTGIPLLAAVGFLLGVGTTLFDSAGQSLIPSIVSREPAGGALFAFAAWMPFGTDALSFAASSMALAAKPGRFAVERQDGTERGSLRADMAEGIRWLLHHRLLRSLALMAPRQRPAW